MLQQEEFIKRLKKIIQDKQLSSSKFADYIQVPRSSISHLLSGRNKPSLDFVMKVVHSYPEIDINWFLFGKQSELVPKSNQIVESIKTTASTTSALSSINSNSSDVEKMVVFYKNGTFKTYEPS